MKTLKFQTNLNCGKCVAAVKPFLDADASIERWSVDTASPQKTLTVEGANVLPENVERDVEQAGFKILDSVGDVEPNVGDSSSDAPRSFLQTYRPLLLVLGYLVGIVAIAEFMQGQFEVMRAMTHFMGGFFIAFSFFKFLDLGGFADAFQTYDVIARRVRSYGFAYPFIELGLGVAYLLQLTPVVTNILTLVVMGVGMIGVTQALWQKRKIQCVCLGTVFNLPMSTVTFLEDALMAGMAVSMLASELIR